MPHSLTLQCSHSALSRHALLHLVSSANSYFFQSPSRSNELLSHVVRGWNWETPEEVTVTVQVRPQWLWWRWEGNWKPWLNWKEKNVFGGSTKGGSVFPPEIVIQQPGRHYPLIWSKQLAIICAHWWETLTESAPLFCSGELPPTSQPVFPHSLLNRQVCCLLTPNCDCERSHFVN